MRFQAYYKGEKLGNPRTEKEKIQCEPCFKEILWLVIPNKEEEAK